MSSFCYRQQPEAKTSSHTNQRGNCFKGKKRRERGTGNKRGRERGRIYESHRGIDVATRLLKIENGLDLSRKKVSIC